MVDENDRENPTPEDEHKSGRGLRSTFGSARQAVSKSYDKVSGTTSRRQFEEFVDVVSTTVLGVHRDQTELKSGITDMGQTIHGLDRSQIELSENVAKMETTIQAELSAGFADVKQTTNGLDNSQMELSERITEVERKLQTESNTPKAIIWTIVLSSIAVVLSIIAVIIAL
jgi:predicted  nucleic acid-binding Zn-ribbon protein